MSEWPLQDARNKLSALVYAALAGKPQHVTRRGEPAVVVFAVDEYERLLRLEKADAPPLGELILELPQDDQDFDNSGRRCAVCRKCLHSDITIEGSRANCRDCNRTFIGW